MMIEKLKGFFSRSKPSDPRGAHQASEHDVHVAVCALFVEMARIDEGFQQQQGVAEVLHPIVPQAPFAQRQYAGGQIRSMPIGQDQKAAVVGDQVQPIILMAEIPADPAITGPALPGRSGKAQQGEPLAAPGGHIPQVWPIFGNDPR